MGKIIALSGTHGTGKSTSAYNLCAALRLAGKNAIVLDELARKCPFPINQGANQQTPVWLLCKQLLEELELQSDYDYVISDRALLDAYCYNLVIHGDAVDLSHFIDVIKQHIATYYHRLYVLDMDSFNYHIDDGFRDMDPTFRAKVHDTLINCYNKFGIKYAIVTNLNQIYEDLSV
jgi:predicted ATPase